MSVLASFGLFSEAPSPLLATKEPQTWATFANALAAEKGFLDASDYFRATYGEEKGRECLRKLQRCILLCCLVFCYVPSLKVISGVHVASGAATPIDALAALLVNVLKYEVDTAHCVLHHSGRNPRRTWCFCAMSLRLPILTDEWSHDD